MFVPIIQWNPSVWFNFYFFIFFVNRTSDNSIVYSQFRGKISFVWAFYYWGGLSRSQRGCGISHLYVNMQSWCPKNDVAYEGQTIIYKSED